ncbi:MAG: HD-GYP domain-containing protein [Xenococcaceae cyanobacterium]
MINQVFGLSLSIEPNSPVINKRNQAPAKILIIDDRPYSRMPTRDLLLLDGYEVLEIDGDNSVFESVITHQPDLVLLDVILSELDGFEVCKLLKQDHRTSQIPIILAAVADTREYRRKVREVDGDDFLTKPFDRFQLSTRVKSLIDQKRLKEGVEQVLVDIAKVMEYRSPDSGNSSIKVASLARSFGEYLQISPRAIESLVFAARVHDIGEVAIPDAILLKKGELTKEERELIHQHVLIGEKLCQPLGNRQDVLPIIRHHHERWDGSGYPDGLVGNQIPKLAQIFQILDIYTALTSERPHKKAYSPTQALEIISEETNKGWRNPEIVKQFTSFIRALEEKKQFQDSIPI